jgi:UrcA family protein
MDNRKFACWVASGFLGVTLTAGATTAFGAPRDVLVQGPRIGPELQRTVAYQDLNLAEHFGQKTLKKRIYRAASGVCFDLNGTLFGDSCTRDAVHSTDDQVVQAIDRAKRQMAGLAVGPAVAISIVIGIQ